jgi:hypothetical protein
MNGGRVPAVRAAQGVAGPGGAAAQGNRRVTAGAGKRPDIEDAGTRRGPQLLIADDGFVAFRATRVGITEETHTASLGPTDRPLLR